jgi:hypothetical protein
MRLFDEDLHFGQFRKNSAVSGIFCIQIIRITPHPFLPRFRGNDNGMARPVVVFGHMLVRGCVTAKGDAAGLTGAKMDPLAAGLYTFFADIFFGELELFDLPHMGAGFLSHILFF